MNLLKPGDLLSLLKDKKILLDTNIFIDALIKPTVFKEFFKELKANNVTITTITPVVIEFLRGLPNEKTYSERKELVDKVVDSYLPITEDIFDSVFELLKLYGLDGKGTEMTDLLLGAILMKHPEKLILITKNTTDFPMNIFTFVAVMNLPYHRSIQTYGIYTYKK